LVDHSDYVSMKNAAKCDSWHEMQKPVNVEFSNSNGAGRYSISKLFWLLDSYKSSCFAMASLLVSADGQLNCPNQPFWMNSSSVSGASWGLVDKSCWLFYQRQIELGYALNLSILIRAGKENNCDSLSNGEWTRNRPSTKPPSCEKCSNVSYAGVHLWLGWGLGGLERSQHRGWHSRKALARLHWALVRVGLFEIAS
jgi:hypothetical protein